MSEVCVFQLVVESIKCFSLAASPADGLPVSMREVQQAERGQQQVSELWERPDVAALSAGHAVLPDPPTPHPIPALPPTEQPATELLQTGHDHEGAPRGDPADTDHEHQGSAAASEQQQVASVSRDVELLRSQKPPQRDEDGGPAARAQRPQ